MKTIYIVSLPQDPQPKAVMAKGLLNFQLRTGKPIKEALALYTRPLTYSFFNKREATKFANGFRREGRTVEVTSRVAS